MSDTPRTDAEAYDVGGIQHADGCVVPSRLARELERELAAQIEGHKLTAKEASEAAVLRVENAKLRNALRLWHAAYGDDKVPHGIEEELLAIDWIGTGSAASAKIEQCRFEETVLEPSRKALGIA